MNVSEGNFYTQRDELRAIKHRAKDAARAKDWRMNHRLCREHDDLALKLGVPGIMHNIEDRDG